MDLSILHFSPILADSTIVDYFMQSNFMGKVIVLALVLLSFIAWGVGVGKKIDLDAIDGLNKKTARALKSSSLVDVAKDKSLKGPYARLLQEAVRAWSAVGNSSSQGDKAVRVAYVENTLERTLSRQLMIYNSKMMVLGTIISGAPFLGLLGTAWGVMDCFGSMSAHTSVTLQMLAPGVAGALLTTVAGLVVAIPSVFGYNYLTSIATSMTTETENFASLISDRIELESRQYENDQDDDDEQEYVKPRVVVQKPVAPVAQQQVYQQPKVVHQVVEQSKPSTINLADFSLDDDDDDDDSPTPSRHYED